jgi:hypothetical protein
VPRVSSFIHLRTAVLFIALAGAACSATPTGEDKRRAWLAGLGEDVLLERYDEFVTACLELDDRVQELCDAPNEATLGAARDAYWAAREPWKRNEVFDFGPYAAGPHRFGPTLDFWPARPSSIEAILNDPDALPGSAEALGADERGLPVIDYLLFERGVDAFESGRRCAYTKTLTEDLIVLSRGIRDAWDPSGGDYLGAMLRSGEGDGAFDDIELAFGEVLNHLGFAVATARKKRLADPLGAGDHADPDAVESRFSGRSLADLRDILRGVEDVCFAPVGADQRSLSSLLELANRPDLPRKLRAALGAGHAALDAVPEPLARAVVEAPGSVEHAIAELAPLERLLSADVVGAFGRPAAFGGTDGD